jgi:hypothetical protein
MWVLRNSQYLWWLFFQVWWRCEQFFSHIVESLCQLETKHSWKTLIHSNDILLGNCDAMKFWRHIWTFMYSYCLFTHLLFSHRPKNKIGFWMRVKYEAGGHSIFVWNQLLDAFVWQWRVVLKTWQKWWSDTSSMTLLKIWPHAFLFC